ncbi:uncharacterized protein LOC121390538 isoform X3 [Gigantopelta aegis]|uniref:uncharacterized protein LOC121390538 isoform X3 n=1 Tax=Gigantopelta aegis TaxID=1735272 RepID=UPI001B888D5E|nr:uncharacterized protein LOC121390538 isoform X3 [Gigantopelta aegis]
MFLWTSLILLIAGWNSCIESLPPGAFCDVSFDVEHKKDQRLVGHVVHVYSGVNVLQCTTTCLTTETRCRSFNYHSVNRVCELNSQDSRLRNNSLRAESGWRYYHRRVPTSDSLQTYGSEHCFKNQCAPNMVFTNLTGLCYSVVLTPLLTMDGASTFCTEQYGRLANLKTKQLFAFIADYIVIKYGKYRQFYSGLQEIQTRWQWSDGDVAKLTYPPWFYDQPDNYANPDDPWVYALW